MAAAVVALVATLAIQGDDDTAVLAEPGETVEAAAATAQPTVNPTPTPTPNPFAVETSDGVVTIRRLSSPAPGVVRAEGDLSQSQAVVNVTSTGQPLKIVTLAAESNGAFVIDIDGFSPGPQEVCLADACQRVLVMDPATESPAVIKARIQEAIAIASTLFDFLRYLPDWRVEIGRANSSVGGTANLDGKQLLINANSGRTLDEYVITVLHEIGHAVDATYVTDAERDRFRSLRSHDPSLPWGVTDAIEIGDDRWRNSGEDFAEVFVAWALNGEYATASTVVAPQPSPADLQAFCELIANDELTCS